VLRWRANGETVDSVRSPVLIRTGVGDVPTLPSELDGIYASGARGKIGFKWQAITPDLVAETNVDPFVVYGTNDAYGLIAEARVYVRPEMSQGGISIQGAETFEQTVALGEQPYLPNKVEVSYNDGSRDNQAIGVNWRFDGSIVNTPGRHVIIGDLILPDYVSQAGATQTTLTLTVGTDTVAPTTTLTWSPAEPNGNNGWYTTAPAFTLQATDAFAVASTQYRVDGGPWTTYPGTPVTVDKDGTVRVEFRSTDTSGNVEEPKAATVKVDTVAPTAKFATTIGEVYFGAVPPAPACTASDDLSGPAGCVVSGYSTEVGTHILLATATDAAGNVGTAVQSYTVLPWTLKGFYSPVGMDGVVNTVKAGSTVPMKFQVFSGDTELTNPALVTMNATQVKCDTGARTEEIEMVGSGATSLRYDLNGRQFVYNWKTPSTPGACYAVTATTSDGSSRTALFKLR